MTRAKSGRISFLDVLSAVPHFFEGLLAVYIVIGGFKVYDAITKHNSARGASTMEFPKGKFAGGANTMVKTMHSRWRRKP